MDIKEVFTAKAVGLYHSTMASNRIPYFGEIFFPEDKKAGLDLRWIKTSKGVPVSLAPAHFDVKAAIRSRTGFTIDNTEMAFFRESTLVTERDRQELQRCKDSNDPYAETVAKNIFDDANTLVESAMVVPERMRMQLLAPISGSPSIYISAKGATYQYLYDQDGSYKANNYTKLMGTSMWNDPVNCDPLEDLRTAQDAVETLTGNKPTIVLMSKKTMGYMVNSAKIRNSVLAHNATAIIEMNTKTVKDLILNELQMTIYVYTKKYKDESEVTHQFYPDDIVTLLPSTPLGKTWYGTTPEECTLTSDKTVDTAIVGKGIAVTSYNKVNPVQTEIIVDEIVLPSYEGMNDTYVISVVTANGAITLTIAAGTYSGKTSVTSDPAAAGTGKSLVYKTGANLALPVYGEDLSAWTAFVSGAEYSAVSGDKFIVARIDSTTKLCEDAGIGTVIVPSLKALTVACVDGATEGKTTITVTEAAAADNSFVYITGSNVTLPVYGQVLSAWTALTSGSEYTATDGNDIVVAEIVTATSKCVGVGKTTAVVQ